MQRWASVCFMHLCVSSWSLPLLHSSFPNAQHWSQLFHTPLWFKFYGDRWYSDELSWLYAVLWICNVSCFFSLFSVCSSIFSSCSVLSCPWSTVLTSCFLGISSFILPCFPGEFVVLGDCCVNKRMQDTYLKGSGSLSCFLYTQAKLGLSVLQSMIYSDSFLKLAASVFLEI